MTLKSVIIMLITLCTVFVQSAIAHDDYIDPPAKINFKLDSSTEFNPSYDLLWEALTPLYKGTNRDKADKNAQVPIIGNAEIDLNGDKIPEIIAYHVESEQEKGTFCKPNGPCPFYIFDTSKTPFKVIGKIYTRWLDLGVSTENGYWTLKAFDNGFSQKETQIYSFDPKKGLYAVSKEVAP